MKAEIGKSKLLEVTQEETDQVKLFKQTYRIIELPEDVGRFLSEFDSWDYEGYEAYESGNCIYLLLESAGQRLDFAKEDIKEEDDLPFTTPKWTVETYIAAIDACIALFANLVQNGWQEMRLIEKELETEGK